MNIKRLLHTIGLITRRGSTARGKYLCDKHIFAEVGMNVVLQPRLVPLYPNLIRLHNNIMVAADVRFITHDASYAVLNNLNIGHYPERVGCIEVMDNIFIGYHATILPNVRIGSNCIIGGCATVTRDLEPNGVYVGSLAKRVGSFDDYVKSRVCTAEGYPYPHISVNQNISQEETSRTWMYFNKERIEHVAEEE